MSPKLTRDQAAVLRTVSSFNIALYDSCSEEALRWAVAHNKQTGMSFLTDAGRVALQVYDEENVTAPGGDIARATGALERETRRIEDLLLSLRVDISLRETNDAIDRLRAALEGK